jgi:AraC-like DNA-binding protein
MELINESFRDFLVGLVGEGEPETFDDESPAGYAPRKQVYRLFAELPAVIDGVPAGLVLAEEFQPSGLGLALRIASHRATLGEAIDSYLQFQHLVASNAARLDPDIGEGCAAVVVERQDDPLSAATREVRSVFQYALALRSYGALIGDPTIRAEAVEFMEITPEFHGTYEEHFGAPVSQSESRNRLIFRRELLERPLVGPDQEAYPYLKELGEIRSRELDEYADLGGGLVGKLRTFLLHVLGVETPTQQQAARHLGVSRRTMQRRLDEEGYDFREVLQAVRERKARDLLDHSDLTNQQIAHELSYNQPSSFYRAFKRWTGQTPTEYRSAE